MAQQFLEPTCVQSAVLAVICIDEDTRKRDAETFLLTKDDNPADHKALEEEQRPLKRRRMSPVSSRGSGKDLTRIAWTKILVKISQQRCWVFNIYEPKLPEAFQLNRIPSEVSCLKNGAQILLTSHKCHNMFLLGGEDKSKYLG